MTDDKRRDARTTGMAVDAEDPNLPAERGDVTGYEGSEQVVGRPEGSDLAGFGQADEMPKEGVPEASPSVPNDALAEPRH